MKKKLVYTLLACTILSCSACGQTEKIEKTEVTIEEIPENGNKEIVSESVATDTETPESETPSAGTTTDAPATSEQSSDIQIEMKKAENKVTDEDGTVLFVKSYTYPVVTIAGNEVAAEKINADIQAKIDAFVSETSAVDYAKEDRQFRLDSGDDSFMEYTEDISYSTARADSNVISFVITNYAYTGGAHGNYGSDGINYNANTGEVINFSELSDDAEKFHTDTLAYLQKLAATDAYQERFYTPDTALSGDLEAALYEDGKWYLSTTGLTFVADPYVLGPYAAGTIEFVIPYDALTEMGLKEEYAYSGNLTIKLQDGDSYTLDINGDGQDDTIQFYTESTTDTDGNYADWVHLMINGNDLSQGSNNELNESFQHYAWSGYTLYDLDETDSTIELVFYSYEEENEQIITCSHFYRYEKDEALTYLGKIQGDISNPTVHADNLLP